MYCKGTKYTLWALFWGALLLAAMPVSASNTAQICASAIAAEEPASKIPKNVMQAISHVESGRYDTKSRAFSAWPWTVNTGGKGYFFDSKPQAVAFVQNLQSRGVQSIDVGCMQINLRHHKNAFRNLDEAFDPQRNVAYAADFLNALYAEKKSWSDAIGRYHSATPIFSEPYKRKVLSRLQRLTPDGKIVQEIKTASLPEIVRPPERKVYDTRKISIYEIDAQRKQAVMAAWQERKRRQLALN